MAVGGQEIANRIWYGASPLGLLVVPLSWLYRFAIWLRRRMYEVGLKTSASVDVPVIVVGNLTVGGTGKTPVTIWLVESLRKRGLRPGVISRGYGGRVGDTPLEVAADSDPSVVGDEPLLIARRCRCPVVVHPDRVSAARRLLDAEVDVVISDDGLQHYRLRRDYEVAVIDGARGLGNGRLLPAGPLREPVTRLLAVQRVLVNGDGVDDDRLDLVADDRIRRFRLEPGRFVRLQGGATRNTDGFAGQEVHALAGIGNPSRFFDLLAQLGVAVIPHPLPDHAGITPGDLDYGDGLPVVMTEKDAVKCADFAGTQCWYLSVDANLSDDDMLDEIQAMTSAGQGPP